MPCLFAIIALITPRVLIVGLWLFSEWFTGIFHTMLWPLLGFLFAPTTLLWYTAVENWFGGQWGTLQIVGLVLTVIIDLSPASGKKKKK